MENYNYGIIGNCTSAALVCDDGSIDWLCLPFFDSSSVFAKILDEKKGGYFKITALGLKKITQSYVTHTPILKTRYETKYGCFEVRDYMPRFIANRGAYYCPSEIHRDILVINGSPKIQIEFQPKPNYAFSEVEYKRFPDYLKIVTKNGVYNSFYLYSNVDYDDILSGKTITLADKSYIVLAYHEKLEPMNGERIFLEYEKTKTYWMDWVLSKNLPATQRGTIIRSLITLKLLMFQRTGAVVAAPTTSLPECIGRERNWDYRYCWVRDSAMIMDLYIRVGDMTSANRFIKFIVDRMLLKNEDVAVMYGINGEKILEEKTLDYLAGYMDSAPVRVGNAAYVQIQNDVYGELMETIYTYFTHAKKEDVSLNEEIWTAVRSLVRKVLEVWDKPDAGIWERRDIVQHYVHSKLMCWVALDRAAQIAKSVSKTRYVKEWTKKAEKIKNDILKKGWNKKLGSFTMSYGSEFLDAANLLMLHYGFLPSDHPKIISTVKASYRRLVKKGAAFRYLNADDFGVPENSFIVCTFWMINALYLTGEKRKAKELFDNILSKRNHLGLLSEDIDINSGRLTGNFPQGYSHLALIQTVLLMRTEYDWSDEFPENKRSVKNGIFNR
ncbi:MAG: glycoside hydrolase family 15 protein [Candidatus Omnitrophica bacterium]|nr:glycoside hydrolase family 15 protein [Candidatus Omnitrophota bacterium]